MHHDAIRITPRPHSELWFIRTEVWRIIPATLNRDRCKPDDDNAWGMGTFMTWLRIPPAYEFPGAWTLIFAAAMLIRLAYAGCKFCSRLMSEKHRFQYNIWTRLQNWRRSENPVKRLCPVSIAMDTLSSRWTGNTLAHNAKHFLVKGFRAL